MDKQTNDKKKDEKRTNEKQKTDFQWHPAFYAGIQIEFAEEADKLIFENDNYSVPS